MFENNSIKQQILNKLSEYKENKLFQEFLDAFYSYIPIDNKEEHNINELSTIVANIFKDFLKKNEECKVKISAIRDSAQSQGPCNIVHLINDDMPFIVDSVHEILYKRKYRILHMINALMYVERDKAGHAISIKSSKVAKPNESVIYIKIVPVKSEEALTRLSSEIYNVLKNARYAVSDWQEMLSQVSHSKQWVASPELNHEEDENVLFLDWLTNDNFTFIGYREYEFINRGSKKKFTTREKNSLGIMKLVDKDFNDNLIEDVFNSDQNIWRNAAITIGKIREVSRVHRYSSFDYICILKKLDGKIVAARVFIGLFVTRLEYQSVTLIPIIRKKVDSIVSRGGFDRASFNGKELFSIVETLPRDELFQLSEDELFLTSMMILSCLNNPRLIVFVRESRCKVFLNLLVFFPKSRVTSDIVEKITNIVKRHIPGKFISNNLKISSMNLAYVQISMKVKDNRDLDVDVPTMERELDKATSLWKERFNHYIEERLRDDKASEIIRDYKKVFPLSYQNNFTIDDAIEDIYYLEQLSQANKIIFRLYKRPDDKRGCLNLKVYSLTLKVDLYHIMPMLDNLGFNAIEEKVFAVDKKIANRNIFIQDFVLDVCKRGQELEKIKRNVEEALLMTYQGHLKSDIINKLILNAALDWRKVYLLNAYCRYLLQIKVPHSQEFIKHTLVKYPVLTRKIVEYFYAKFEKDHGKAYHKKARKEVIKELSKVLDNIEDKVFKKLLDIIDNTLRTNYFQKLTNGECKKYISFKFDSKNIADIPAPAPLREIFVYSANMEGVHLRGGKVARGGLRWSDHTEDYRNEILGLMKAQMTKNAVIVPDGAKGGFVIKNGRELHSKDEIFSEGVKAYKIFLAGILDITDNVIDGSIVRPKNVVCYDDHDPYLVVAADKGTATFSDTANEIAASYNFWLGDAFASGGSAGYDHKKMAITARGAWVSVREHFKAQGTDPNKDDITVIGIGDMSGDVFGNGMLLSKHIKLVAAFNHIHIFVDPNPDPKISYEERKRLFKKSGSQWTDYNEELISQGGGVFSRKVKAIPVSPQMSKLLDIEENTIEPEHLIQKILCAQVDLLWNGGIGTYVKSENESQEAVGDKPNDNVRVNGHDLRCKVVGEGGNLGLTQLGRVEYALNGGAVNTDFIDNSAGVDCSDHEVNIKIALGSAITKGKLDIKNRNRLLDKMRTEVAHLVLQDNLVQHTAISISHFSSTKLAETKMRLIDRLKDIIGLNPKLEYLPSVTEMNRRAQEKLSFTRPEIAVILSYSKMAVYKSLVNSRLPDDNFFKKHLIRYFPELMHEEFVDEILDHQLRKEIISTIVSNHIVNYTGSHFFHDAQEYTGLKGCDIARAYYIVWEIFKIEDLWKRAAKITNYATRVEIFYDIRTFMQKTIYWFLRNINQPLNVEKVISVYSEGTSYLIDNITKYILNHSTDKYNKKVEYYKNKHIQEDLAKKMSILDELYSAMDIVDVSIKSKLNFSQVAETYFKIGEMFHYNWLVNKADALEANSYWKRMLTKTIKDNIYDQQRILALKILQSDKHVAVNKRIDNWCGLNKGKIMIYNRFIDSIRCMEDIDSAKLVVSVKQGEVLINK